MAIDIFKTKGEDPGILDGDYNTWTHVWTNDFPGGILSYEHHDHYIDEKNKCINIGWLDSASKARFGVFDLSDFSTVFLSPSGTYYLECAPYVTSKNFTFGSTLCNCGISRSIQSYLLLNRADHITMEVWANGVCLWNHDIQSEVAGTWSYSYSISPTGKYIAIVTYTTCKIVLYEGSKV